MASPRALVIGYGNPLREDDGMGCRAAELLSDQLPPEAVEIIQCHQLTPELAPNIADAALVVFLDAASDQEPGAVSSGPVNAAGDVAWSHHLSPSQLLSLSEQLGRKAPPAFLIRGGILRMDFAEGLTSAGEQAACQMANAAFNMIKTNR